MSTERLKGNERRINSIAKTKKQRSVGEDVFQSLVGDIAHSNDILSEYEDKKASYDTDVDSNSARGELQDVNDFINDLLNDIDGENSRDSKSKSKSKISSRAKGGSTGVLGNSAVAKSTPKMEEFAEFEDYLDALVNMEKVGGSLKGSGREKDLVDGESQNVETVDASDSLESLFDSLENLE